MQQDIGDLATQYLLSCFPVRPRWLLGRLDQFSHALLDALQIRQLRPICILFCVQLLRLEIRVHDHISVALWRLQLKLGGGELVTLRHGGLWCLIDHFPLLACLRT